MLLKDIKAAIEGLEKEFGPNILNNPVFFDSRFGNEVIVDMGECITTLVNVPSEEDTNENIPIFHPRTARICWIFFS